MRKLIQLVSTHYSGTKRRWRKTSSHQLLCTQQDHQKICLAMPKVEDIHSQLNGMNIFTFGSMSRISLLPIRWVINTEKQPSLHHFGNMDTWKYLWTPTSTSLLPGTHDWCLKGFPFTITYLDDIIIFSRAAKEHLDHIRQVFKKLWKCSFIDETQQMSLLCKRNPVSWTHTQHHMHQTTANEDPSHQQHASTENAKQVHAFLGLVRYYRKFIKNFARIAKQLTFLTCHMAKFQWTTAPIQNFWPRRKSSHRYLFCTSLISKEIHRLHECLGWWLWSTIIIGTWWNQIHSCFLISHLHWNRKEMEYPRTGSIWCILCNNQMTWLPPRIQYHSLQQPQTTSQIPKWKEHK